VKGKKESLDGGRDLAPEEPVSTTGLGPPHETNPRVGLFDKKKGSKGSRRTGSGDLVEGVALLYAARYRNLMESVFKREKER